MPHDTDAQRTGPPPPHVPDEPASAIQKAVEIVGDLLVSAWRSPLKKYLLYSLAIHAVLIGVLSAGTLYRLTFPAEHAAVQEGTAAEASPAAAREGAGRAKAEGSASKGEEGKPPKMAAPETSLEELMERSDSQ